MGSPQMLRQMQYQHTNSIAGLCVCVHVCGGGSDGVCEGMLTSDLALSERIFKHSFQI